MGIGGLPAGERLARRFHEAYERLAPSYGYETRAESAVPWDQVPDQNRALMVAVCNEILTPLFTAEIVLRPVEGKITRSAALKAYDCLFAVVGEGMPDRRIPTGDGGSRG